VAKGRDEGGVSMANPEKVNCKPTKRVVAAFMCPCSTMDGSDVGNGIDVDEEADDGLTTRT